MIISVKHNTYHIENNIIRFIYNENYRYKTCLYTMCRVNVIYVITFIFTFRKLLSHYVNFLHFCHS